MGTPIDAQTALAWGLVNRVVDPGRAVSSAIELAAEMATRPGFALQACKKAVDLAFDMSEDEAIERTLAISTEVFAPPRTAKEGGACLLRQGEAALPSPLSSGSIRVGEFHVLEDQGHAGDVAGFHDPAGGIGLAAWSGR